MTAPLYCDDCGEDVPPDDMIECDYCGSALHDDCFRLHECAEDEAYGEEEAYE